MKKITVLLLLSFISLSGFSQTLQEGFEGAVFPPTTPAPGWVVFQNAVGSRQWGPSIIAHAGLGAAQMNSRQNNGINTTSTDYLVTPLVTIPANGQLRFWARTENNGNQGTLYQVRVASGTNVANQTNEAAFNVAPANLIQQWTEDQISTTYNIYEEKVVDFPAALIGTAVYIAFVNEYTQTTATISGDTWYLDDVLLVSKCLAPTLLTANPILSTSATLGWTNSNGPTSGNPCSQWEVEIIPATGTFTGTGIIVNTNPYTIPINTLTPLTDYKYRVRSICTYSTSDWATFLPFTTSVAPLGCNGNYVDSGGTTGNYQINENIITTISPTNPGDLVTVTFTSFNTEATYDGMYVYDGPSTASPQISSANPVGSAFGALSALAGAYWGTALPGPFTATSANGSLTFNFKSDGSVTKAGWVATIGCSRRPTCTMPSGLIATSITTTSVNLTWTQPSNPDNSIATAWQYIYLPCASPAPTAATPGWISANSNNVNVSNLTPGTCYKFYVRADCTNNDYSGISASATVSTPLCNSGCNYRFIMRDSFGDGWNGNTMSVIQNGITIATLTGPTAAQGTALITVSVPLCPGPFQLFWNTGGTFSSEVGISITSFLGTVLYTHAPGTGLQNSLLFSADARCIPPTCLQPTNLITTGITSNSVTLGWTNTGLATSWQVIALSCGSPAPTANATGWLPVSTNSLLIGNLMSGCYDFYVRGVCSPTDSSDWSSIQGITLLPPSCANTTPAGNDCSLAVPICNFNGYCGNTSAAYTVNTWPELTTAFCGSIDNNSFLSFIASSSTISLNVWVTSSALGYGVQMMVYSSVNCGRGTVTSYTCWNPGVYSTGMSVVTATGLTPGNTYYLMIDGYAGDVCNYVIGAGSGIQTVQVDVTTPNASICLGQSANLNVSGGNNTYVWSPPTGLSATSGSSVTFTPTAVGTYTFTATSSNGSAICPQPLTDSQIITVRANATPTFTQLPNICQNSVAPLLPTISTNTVGITGTWNSAINTSTLGTSIYTFNPTTGQCAIPSTMQVTISPSPVATFNYIALPYCQNASNPSPTFSGGGVAGVFTSTTGLSINATTGVIDLAASTAGTYTVTNTIAASGSCAQVVATAQVTITALPVATFNYNSTTYCKTGANPILAFTAGGVAGVFSSSTGLTITSAGAIDLSTSTPGNYIITNTIAASAGCGVVTATFAISISLSSVATFSYTGTPYCSNATNPSPTFSGGGGAGVFTSTTGLIINATTGAIDLAASTAGAYTVTNTVAASGSCAQVVATSQVTITALPVATFNYNSATYCKTGANPTLAFTAGGVAGVFSSSTGLTITSAGAIDLSTSTPGNYIITNTIAASTGCGVVTATFAIAITAPPVATFSYTGTPYCSNATNPSPTFSGGGVAGVFTSTTGLIINAATGVINLAASTAGAYTVTNTIAASGSCAQVVATSQVTITALPVATFNYNSATYCKTGANPTLAFTAGGVAGVFSSSTGLTITSAGAIDLSTSTPGNYIITNTIAASTGCGVVTATFAIAITAPPVATFSYTGTPYCSNATNPSPTFSGGGIAGVFTSTTGLSINATTGVINVTASTAGTYTVTNTIASAVGCAAVIATAQVIITTAPQATISYSDAFYCYNNSGSQAVILTGTTGGTFSATPSGLTLSTVSGVINASTSQAGTYIVTYIVPASGGCPQFTTTTTVIIVPEITVELSDVCDGQDFTITALPVAGSFNPLTAIYEWTGPNGYTFGPSSNPSIIVLTPGTYISTVTFNGCTHVNSQLVNSITCSIQKGISPNGDGDNEAFILADVKAISIFNRYGSKVYSHGANYTNEWHGQSSSGSELPDGTYYYVITRSSGESITGWIYINR